MSSSISLLATLTPSQHSALQSQTTFQVNHLGHHLLVNLLLPLLAPDANVVFVSSGTHDPAAKTGHPEPVYTSADQCASHPLGCSRICCNAATDAHVIGFASYCWNLLCCSAACCDACGRKKTSSLSVVRPMCGSHGRIAHFVEPGFAAGQRRYATSKLLNVYCTYELARRLAASTDARLRSVRVNAIDPG